MSASAATDRRGAGPGEPAAVVHPADRITDSARETGSLACVGLDPRPELIPPALRRAALARFGDTPDAVADAFVAFNLGVLDAAAGRCAAVKPQAACYEAYGSAGWRALEATVEAARQRGLPVIVDGKRNDIGSTATHYRDAFFGGAPGLGGTVFDGLGGTWMTVNGYLGSDGVEPFLATPGHGVFVLVRTSNPSAAELQEQPSGAVTVAERMAELVAGWGEARRGRCGLGDVGAVVGATWPAQARALRAVMADTLFLVPGYGAQGGSARDALAGRRRAGGELHELGLLVSSSRQILAAWQRDDPDDWTASVRRAIDAMNADLTEAAESTGQPDP